MPKAGPKARAVGALPGTGPATDADIALYVARGTAVRCDALQSRVRDLEATVLVLTLLALALALRARQAGA